MRQATWMLALVVLLAGVAQAQPQEPGQRRYQEVDDNTQLAIELGLRYLAESQNDDGSWTEAIGRKVNYDYRVDAIGEHVGVTALACMAFLSAGSVPNQGPYGENVQRGLNFLLEVSEGIEATEGYITLNGSRMYSHAFVTLFLAEAYGMTGNPRVRKALKAAVNLIVGSQNELGGWRYKPNAKDADLSVTVTMVMALRAARNAGIAVPGKVMDDAIAYVRESYISDYAVPDFGGFEYQGYERRSRTSFALTAAGVTALYGAGEYHLEEVKEGIRYLFRQENRPEYSYPWTGGKARFDWFYGHYYAVQAFYQAGQQYQDGNYYIDYWQKWWPYIRDRILIEMNVVHPNGSTERLFEQAVMGGQPRLRPRVPVNRELATGYWEDLVGRTYATAMATIILQVPNRYLPIFER